MNVMPVWLFHQRADVWIRLYRRNDADVYKRVVEHFTPGRKTHPLFHVEVVKCPRHQIPNH